MSRLMSSLPRLARSNVRSFMKGEVRRADPKVVEEIKTKQTNFQAPDEPVHMKAGKIHFYVTTAVGVLAFIAGTHGLYKMLEH